MDKEPTQDEGVADAGSGVEQGAVEQSPSVDYPSSWREQDRQHWDQTPEDVRKIIAARESNWAKESQRYKQAHENWSKYDPLIRRYDPLFQAEGVAPDQGIANVLQLAHNLRFGDEATKQQILDSLTGFYGKKKEDQKPQRMDPELGEVEAKWEQKYNELAQAVQSNNQQFRQYVDEGVRRDVTNFAKQPDHKHFDKLGNMMGKFLNAGLAGDLEDAYKMSLKHHPELVEKAQVEQQQNQTEIKKAQSRQALQAAGVNVRGNGRAPQGTQTQKSLRKALEDTFDKAQARQ